MSKMRIILLSLLSLTLFACKSDLTNEKALELLTVQSEFKDVFYAPFHVGNEVLNGNDHKNPDKYIKEHLGELIDEGLVEAKVTDTNSWRSVLSIRLTDKGLAMTDPKRSTEKSVHVQACLVTPTKVTQIRVVTPDQMMVADFEFTMNEVTPFGRHLGFQNGTVYSDSRTFVRSGWGWEIE